MGNTLAEIDQALKIVNEVMPTALGAVSFFFPQAAVITPFLPLFQQVISAVDIVQQDTGKPVLDVIQDVINHLTPGQPNAPALSPTPAVPAAA
jgi:hypothetical protein